MLKIVGLTLFKNSYYFEKSIEGILIIMRSKLKIDQITQNKL